MVAQVKAATPGEAALVFANCSECPLNPKRRPVIGHGNQTANLVVVGEAPGFVEHKEGMPFIGPSGRLLDAALERSGTRRKDVWVTNTVLCRPTDQYGDDAPPPKEAVAACRPRLLAELRMVNPSIILSVGASAAKSLLDTKQGITEIQGVVEHREDLPAPVLPTFHPASVLHGAEDNFESILSAARRAAKIASGELVVPDRNERIPWKHVTQSSELIPVLQDIMAGVAGFDLAIDVETGGLDVLSDPLLQVAIGNRDKAVVIEADVLTGPAKPWFVRLLSDPRFTWIIHNSSFDLQWLQEHFGVTPPNVVDTMCLALGISERKGMAGLKRLAREWLNAPYYEDAVHGYLNADGSGWEKVPRPILAEYAAKDIIYTARMLPLLVNECEEEGTLGMTRDLLMPAQRVFAEVERHGVRVDLGYLSTLEAEWTPRIAEAERAVLSFIRSSGLKYYATRKRRVVRETIEEMPRWRYTAKNGTEKVAKTKPKNYPDAELIFESVPKQRSEWEAYQEEVEPNIGSDQQMQQFVFDHLKLAMPDGKRTIDKSFKALHADHPFVKLHEDWRLANRMMTTYVRGIKDDVREDGRVHPNIDIRGAVTGRLAMHNPPLQVIPKEEFIADKFASIKRLFLPSPGHVWVSTDYAQLEVRVAWHLSNDDQLGEAVMSGDFHTAMAAKVFKVPVESVTKEQRHKAKTINFGIFYGITGAGLSQRLGISEEDGQALIDDFFAAAPKYRDWYFEQHRTALTEGRITTPFGRVRRWSLITRTNKQNVLNQSVNFPVQSVASDLNLTAFMKIHRELRRRGWGSGLFLVHDSTECEVREDRIDEAVQLIQETMVTWPFPSYAVLDVETKVGPTWGDTTVWSRR